MNPLKKWLSKATPHDRAELAETLGMSPGMLRWIAGGYRTEGKIDLDAKLAVKIEHATEGAVRREQLCRACARCEYAKRARGG